MNENSGRPWPTYLLGLAAIGAILAAYLVVGPPSQSTASATRIVTAQSGVVASTVSGSGNVEAAKQLDLGFKTDGVVNHIYVSQGQHVVEGQLLAELNPESAEVTLEQARATLKTAEANLEQEEETDGESPSSSGAGDTRATTASVDYTTRSSSSSEGTEAATQSTSGTSVGQKTPTEGAGHAKQQDEGGGTSKGSSDVTKPASSREQDHKVTSNRGASSSSSSNTSSSGKGSSSTLSSAARAANIASASAAVKSDKLVVQSDEEALANTKLYAPQTGTLVSLSGEVGEAVSGTGTTKASSGGSSSSSEDSNSAASSSALGRSTTTASRESSDGSSSSGSSFAMLSDLSSMQLVVPMSESEIGQVKDGQTATVTIEALEGSKLAAEVTAISILPTSNSGVVSYDVTFTLDQLTEGLRPGMSATAEVVVKQAEGVNVPSSAITGGAVTVLKEGKQLRRSVLTGLAGNTATIVLSGLSAGEQVVLPAARSTSSTSSLLSRLGSKLGGGGLGGGAFRGSGGAGFATRALGG